MIRRIRKGVLGLLGLGEAPVRRSAPPSKIGRVREVMRPRGSVVALPLVATEGEIHALVRRERHSCYPVYGSSLDDIVGVFVARDLRRNDRGMPFVLARHLREPVFVPDTRPVHLVVDDLRKARAHMAIVLDEAGGTAGIATLGDLMVPATGDQETERDGAQRRRAGGRSA